MLLSLCLLTGCSFRPLHETLHIVGEADSLWQQGLMYDDSTQLARTYSTLHAWRAFYTDEYAHACYHYGKLLRAKEDPVSAMQVFIDATHSGTKDYQILGRIYNNMGDICHRAEEFTLSYDMFERSADVFMRDHDNLSYYYCLNDMAYELAEQGKKEEAFSILANIDSGSSDEYLRAKSLETKAEACLYAQLYDSALFYTSLLLTHDYNESEGLLIRAQSYSFLNQKDSSVYYANLVLTSTNEVFNLNNALYILTQNDSTKDITAVRETSADRSDIQKLIEINRGKHAKATQLLEQDMTRKPQWWPGFIIAILIIVGVFAVIWNKRKSQMHKQHLSEMANKQAESIIESIRQHIDISDLKRTLHWNDYSAMKVDANLYMGGIVSKLEAYNLNETEIRFCILTILDFRQKQIAETIYYSYPSGLKTLKKRISDKLGTTPPELKEFLLHLPP